MIYIEISTSIKLCYLKCRCTNSIKFRSNIKHTVIILSINMGKKKFMPTYTNNILLDQMRYREMKGEEKTSISGTQARKFQEWMAMCFSVLQAEKSF